MKNTWKTILATAAVTLAVTSAVPFATLAANPANQSQAQKLSSLDAFFAKAAKEFHVPKELLMAVSYSETRWHDHADEPSADNGFGLMHLTDNAKQKGLVVAAQGLGLDKKQLEKSTEHNIRGGALLLAKYQKDLGKDLSADVNDWYEAVASYEQTDNKEMAVLFADEVYRLLKEGISLGTDDGASLAIAANKAVEPKKGQYAGITYGASQGLTTTEVAGYPGAIWNPASTSNYQVASRPTSNAINSVIIHDTEGSYSGTISWFKDPAAQVSAHYVVRSSDGQITQMVDEKDIAWHARSFNTNGIGVEHEGYADQTGWYTDAMYRASAALVKNICTRYGIPMDRDHILAHSELWGNTHTDPGKNWDWNYYMSLITGVTKNYSVVEVDDSNFENTGFTLYGPSQYWHPMTGYGIHNQMNYTNGNGSVISNYGIWKPTIPTAGNYEIKAFVPSNYAATTGAKYEIHYNGGVVTKTVSQSLYSNQWVSLGTYNFAVGTAGYVKLGDNTGDTATIGFDGMKFMAR
jgi:N-acetyl-anhydromuramyl-L-alanine amidase AmpD